jgi:hypothetical protein
MKIYLHTHPALFIIISIVLFTLATGPISIASEEISFRLDFEQPISWADDVCPWGNYRIQHWEIADGGRPGKALRISSATYGRTSTYEIRTLQFNHEPNTPITIKFNIRAASNPPGSFFLVRYFDGYCTASAFHWAVNDEKHPFPPPIFDSRRESLYLAWKRVSVTTPPLKNTVATIALVAQQPDWQGDPQKLQYLDYYIDNFEVTVTPLDKLMDPDFEWHGNYGSTTIEFRRNTLGANCDWCDFADQEEVVTPDGVIRYTLFQFRDASTQTLPGIRHELKHAGHYDLAWGTSTVSLIRSFGAGNLSAVSWGVRQTVSYQAIGLGPDDTPRVRVRMKLSNAYSDGGVCKCQLGVDPWGGVSTQKAMWTALDNVNIWADCEGWRTHSIEFIRPKGSKAFTIYFRQRDGLPQPAKDQSYPPAPREPQSQGSSCNSCSSFADWVLVEVIR